MQNTRKKIRPEQTLFLLTVLIFITSSCNTRESGCLDPEASNFDLTAEKACDDCCKFPTMSLTLSQKWNSENFIPTDTFYDQMGKAYQIIDIQYFLSSWTWKSKEDQISTVDSTSADCSGQTLIYTQDINVVDPRKFVYTLGTFRKATQFDTVTFHMGLVEDFSCLEDTLSDTPDILTPSSPLWNPATSSLSTIRLILKKNPLVDSLLDTLYIDLHQQFTIPYSYKMERGANYSFLLSVNYAMWFEQVDLDNINSFSTSIMNGLQGSITKTE